ncbi:MAG: GntR family transcriptional regulator [Ruminiclostridium sp.]
MYINKKSPIPAYYQLKNKILEKINSGEYIENSLIPSERELSDSSGISRMTVRQALTQLVSEGTLYREKGKGTFVSKSKIAQTNVMSFSETVESKGMLPTTKVLRFEKIKAPDNIQKILELEDNELVYNVKRLRFANNIPVAIEEDFIPEKYCSNLDTHDLTGSLYKLLTEEYSYNIDYLENIIEANKPSKEEKELLNITSSIPILKIDVVIHTDTNLKLLYENSKYRSDEYKYNVLVYGNKNPK